MLRGRVQNAVCTSAAAALLFSCAEEEPATTAQAPPEEPTAAAARYVGRESCAECHPEATEDWLGSDHDLAMEPADETTVLGDFDGATHTHFGVTSTFFRRDGKFLVRTEGPDGELAEFEVASTFGVRPLQQYLVGFPGGRLQTLPLCWDTRPADEGGQRWFHIYPDEPIPPSDYLHWTGPIQNWNHMCADCHSTNLRKTYLPDEDRFETTFSEIDVSCEACHGPGSRHVSWARTYEERQRAEGDVTIDPDDDLGLDVRLEALDDGVWQIDPETGSAKRSVPRTSRHEIETCARCHARRSPIHPEWIAGTPFLDTYRLATLDEALYHPDGQILEEVYVYGSFLQSKMYAEGVTCTDCHEPHTARVYIQDNGLCARCHDPTMFDTPAHHFHREGTLAARCVECHMPEETYMVIDPRRDHSIRVPRPDLSKTLGTPNVCNECHDDRSVDWSIEAIEKWYGEDRRNEPHWGEALHAGRLALEGAEEKLQQIIEDPEVPGIARATALTLFPSYATPASLAVIRDALRDPDPLVRAAAVGATESVEPMTRLRWVYSALSDSVRAVRHEATRVLASMPPSLMSPDQREKLEQSLTEVIDAALMDADRADGRLRLGTIRLGRGELFEAEREYKRAIEISPAFPPPYVNLADLYREMGADAKSEQVLREGIARIPGEAGLHHALGLALVRLDRHEEALVELERAVALDPDRPRYRYVLAVGRHSMGDGEGAIREVREAAARHPGDPELHELRLQLEAGL